MSDRKRKDAPGDHPPAKSAKKGKEGRPAKTDGASDEIKPKSAGVTSILKEEEPMFPRGGGNILTPLEQKQINLDAKADAKNEEEFDTTSKAIKKKKSKSKLKEEKKGSGKGKKEEEDTVKIESLSFSNLVKGSIVLGQISQINNLDLEIAMPNNLTGHVSIAAVSDQLTKRLESGLNDEGSDDDNEEVDVELASMFQVGQFIRAYVQSTKDNSENGGNKKKIELSLRPQETNLGLEKDDVVVRGTLMAAVVSVEDHGCVMDIGFKKITGFLPKAEINPSITEDRLQPGAVFLTSITGKSGDKVVKLSTTEKALGSVGNAPQASTINTFLPGTPVDVLVTGNEGRGLCGKILGSLDVTADAIHSGYGPTGTDIEATYKVGTRIQARVICNFPSSREPRLGISLLPHIKSLTVKKADGRQDKMPTEALPLSSGVDKCEVTKVDPALGLFVDVGVKGLKGFVHISRVQDGKVEALYQSSGPYQTGSTHKGRVIGYNGIDALFYVSFEKSVLARRYLRVEDVPVGAVVNDCEITKINVKEKGVTSLVLKINEGITGFVSDQHFSDIRLQHPEKKFRPGMKVKARVIFVDPSSKQIRLTMKKTLVNSEAPVIKDFSDVKIGLQVPCMIMNINSSGANVNFYGSLKGFLPVGQMSEAYVKDPHEHFRTGQVISVHILDADEDQNRIIVSCKDPSVFGLEKQNALKALKIGDVVSAKVAQKTEEQIYVELDGSGLKAMLHAGHLTDKSASKNASAFKKIHAGQTMKDLLVIDKDDNRRSIVLSQKPSLIEAAKEGKLITSFEEAVPGIKVAGFVKNVTQTAVFVQFGGKLDALLPKSRLSAEQKNKPDFGLTRFQSLEVKIVSSMADLQRILVASVDAADEEEAKPKAKPVGPAPKDGLVDGTVIKATVKSVKDTQINIKIPNSESQGRIDVSQIFDSWSDIEDPKDPLAPFKKLTPNKSELKVKLVGVYDAKHYSFLPFSHRATHSVLEASHKPSALKNDKYKPLSIDNVKVGEEHVAFVNNVAKNCLWVHIAPGVRGRITAMDASDDLALLADLEANFPIGMAMKVRITSKDKDNKLLNMTARSGDSEAVTWKSLKKNMVLPGFVTKVTERSVMVKLSEEIAGPVHLPDMVDNFDEVNTHNYKKGEVVRVSVVELDVPNKQLRLSTRPSRIMSSTLPVKDREITNISQVQSGDIVRGFVKNVADKGLFVLLGGKVSAMVKISNLSDRFLKEWKDQFQVDQLVKGRVIFVDNATQQVELSLKASSLGDGYEAPASYNSIREGQIVTGKVRKVEAFGAFIVLDNSDNVSGLCHRSQMADTRVEDATKLYQEGDKVKAIVLEVDAQKRKMSLGLKPSFFDDEEDEDMDSDEGAALNEDDEDEDSDEDVDMSGGANIKLIGLDSDDSDDDMLELGDEDDEDEDDDEDDEEEDDEDDEEDDEPSKSNGLGAGKKSKWTEDPFAESGAEDEDEAPKKSKKKQEKNKKAEIQVDRTADLDINGPQTSSDYERLLLGQPDSSELWIAYMAFQMQVSELSKAREVAERAIKTINIREEADKLNVWIAYLNLEVAYGNKHTVEDVFKRACQYNNEQEVYERLASIYIQSEKLKEADDLFETMIKKFGAKAPNVWINYAHFLHVTQSDPVKARTLLPRATQRLDKALTANVISRFAALEFTSPNGEPEVGRTMFESLLAAYPKKGDLWSQLIDLETGVAGEKGDATAVRDVFERRTKVKGLKPQQAEKWFRRWAAWEEKRDGSKGKERILAKAQDWLKGFAARKEAEAAAAAEDEEMEE